MRTFVIICMFMVAGLIASGQVTVQTNLPSSIAPNTDVLFEVKLTKGAITNFSKYQVDVPAGVTVSEGDSRTGNFTFEDNRAKVVWVSIPSEPEFVLTFKMNTGGASGAGVFNQKFYFLENGSKKEVEFDPVNVTFDASGAKTLASLGGSLPTATTSTEPKSTVTMTDSPNTPASNTASETPVANVETNTTTTSNSNSGNTTTPTETPVSTPVKTEPEVTKTTPPVETKTTPTETKTSTTSTPASTAKSTSGLVYKVQLSASATDPGKSKFSSAGNVTISREDGLYKVLVGSFSSKEEAIEKMNQLKSSGWNGFVVKYQNGVRVK
jgi:hypothetical protein